MNEPNDLRVALIGLVNYAHETHRRLDELASTVFALQSAVRGLDPTFDDVREAKAAEISAALQPIFVRREE